MASPAEVANDMDAHASFWKGRDAETERVCRDAARVIRALLNGDRVDGRTYGGLHRRLLKLTSGSGMRYAHTSTLHSLDRARCTLETLHSAAARCGLV